MYIKKIANFGQLNASLLNKIINRFPKKQQ